MPPAGAAGTRIWYWQSQEDKFPNATNPTVYSAFNKFDLASSTAPLNCLAASWSEAFNVTGTTSVWAWTGQACTAQLPFMCKRKRKRTAAVCALQLHATRLTHKHHPMCGFVVMCLPASLPPDVC
jgi:hypothetical protein